jgi:hypothetical protein
LLRLSGGRHSGDRHGDCQPGGTGVAEDNHRKVGDGVNAARMSFTAVDGDGTT